MRSLNQVLCWPFALAFLLAFASSSDRVEASEAVGSVVGAEPVAQIRSGDDWEAATVGAEIFMGSSVRTETSGRLKMLFLDDSVLELTGGSQIVVDEAVYNPNKSVFQSTFNLLKGQVRSLVSDYYEDPLSDYEVETPASVSGVRGTDFIVTYDEDDDFSETIVFGGRVEVHGTIDRQGNGVVVGPGQFTTVYRGKYPSEPKAIPPERVTALRSGFAFIGLGVAETMLADDVAANGSEVPDSERAETDGPGGTTDGPSRTEPPPSHDGTQPPRRTPGGVAGQPVGTVDTLGNLKAEF